VEQAYEQTRVAICSYLLCLGVPRDQAQEVTQEVYLRLYQTMRKGKEILNMRAWLFRVAHNLGLNVRSRERAFRAVSPDWDRFVDRATVSPERAVLDREKIQRLEAALENTVAPTKELSVSSIGRVALPGDCRGHGHHSIHCERVLTAGDLSPGGGRRCLSHHISPRRI
jgi:hypothetical protein